MPPRKRRRLELATRRATRQTPVVPPATAARAPPPPPSPSSSSSSSPPPSLPSPPPPLPPPPSSSALLIADSQTPVSIPAPSGLRSRHRQRPPQAPATAVETPVPLPAVPPPSPRSDAVPGANPSTRRSMSVAATAAIRDTSRASNLVAPEITYHVPRPPHLTGRVHSSLLRPHGPSALPPRLDRRPAPAVVTPVPPPKPPTLAVNDRGPPRPDRNIDKVVLGDLCFRTWYPSYYGKEVLGDASANTRTVGGGSKDGHQDAVTAKVSKRDKDLQPMLERLYVCPCCFKYAKELVAWRGHVRLCERRGHVPGKRIYAHPRGRRRILVAHDGKGPGPKRRRGDGATRYTEEYVQDEGEWGIWEVDGEKDGLFCQNLSLFAKLFLDNKSVFFDVAGFNYFLLVYTPPPSSSTLAADRDQHRRQIVGFFSKEKMSWDNNNLACILVFPPWQRKGLGALLMGVSYEISRREGIMGGPEKPISDLGKKGYKRFWTGEIARWLLGLESSAQQGQRQQPTPHPAGNTGSSTTQELVVDVNDCGQCTWIAVEDCLGVLRDMGIVEDAGLGPGRPDKVDAGEVEESAVGQSQDPTETLSGGAPPPHEHDAGSSKVLPDRKSTEPPESKLVRRVRVDKEAVRRYVATHRINLERTCDPTGFTEGYAMRAESSDSL